MTGKTCAGLWVTGTGKDGEPRSTYLYHVVDNEWSMQEYGHQCVVWQTAINPVVALELLATRHLDGRRRAGPGGVRRRAVPRPADRVRQPVGAAGDVTCRRRSPLRGLSKHFGDVRAVDDLDLEIADGEFFSMLGPSGSGKTTVLRLIAGFEQPTAGRILLGDEDVTDRPPFARDVNTVFQDYAIFPHMSVRQNVEYGLRVKKVARERAPHAGPRRRWRPSASRGTPSAGRTSSPAASGSGSRWPGPWSTGPRCCCSTSRSVRSTSSCAARCRSSSSRSSARSASPSCS